MRRASHPTGPKRRTATAAIALWPGLWTARTSWGLEAPGGRVVLSITGGVEAGQARGRADFDMAMLEALPQASFVTGAPWYERPHRFTGPLLREVLKAAGARGKTLRAIALNEYHVEIPFDDALRFEVIVARLLDGEPIPVRAKGPLLIIYPFDGNPAVNTAVYQARSAWQLRTIEVR